MAFLNAHVQAHFVSDARQIYPLLKQSLISLGFQEGLSLTPYPSHSLTSKNGELRVLSDLRYAQIYSQQGMSGLSSSTNGFFVPPQGEERFGRAYVKEGELGRVLVTSLHEFGHLLGEMLEDSTDEEARAYSFAKAGINSLKIPSLAYIHKRAQDLFSLRPDPVEHPHHHPALEFVIRMCEAGMDPLELYELLCSKQVSVSDSTRFFRK